MSNICKSRAINSVDPIFIAQLTHDQLVANLIYTLGHLSPSHYSEANYNHNIILFLRILDIALIVFFKILFLLNVLE